MQLSKYFTLEQLTRSDTAKRKGIDNSANVFAQNSLQQLALRLDILYDTLGPFRISSGYRSPALNEAIHGSANSYHTRGIAADIIPVNDTAEGYFKKIARSSMLNNLGEIINEADEKGVVHVSLPTAEKVGVLMYLKDGSYYRYSPRQLDELLGRNQSGSAEYSTYEPVPESDMEEGGSSFSSLQMALIAASVALFVIVGLSVYSAKRNKGATA